MRTQRGDRIWKPPSPACGGGAFSLAAALLLAVALPALAESLPIDRTHSSHQVGPRLLDPIEPAPPADHLYRRVDTLAYRLPGPLTKWAARDVKLSHLCRLGAFGQQWPKALYAMAEGNTYGVAFAEGANLHDPQRLAVSGFVYFFSYGETSACEVLKAPQPRVAAYATSRFGRPASSTGGR